MQHPDITRIEQNGYAGSCENRDDLENRERYIKDRVIEIMDWLKSDRPDVLDDFIFENQYDYQDWLN